MLFRSRLTPAQVTEHLDSMLLSGGAVLRLNDAARGDGVIVAQQHRAYDPSKTVPTLILRNDDYGRVERLLADGEDVRILTSLLTVPAHIIATLYKYRWQVELFFKWLKSYGNFNHLISHTREGVLLSFYVTIIGVVLMYLHTSFRPSKYAMTLLGFVAQGASLEEIMPILRERERQCEVERQGAAKRRAKKKAAGN